MPDTQWYNYQANAVTDEPKPMTKVQKLLAAGRAVAARCKKEAVRRATLDEIASLLASHVAAIRKHPPPTVAIYAGKAEEIRATLPTVWSSESDEIVALSEKEVDLIRRFIACTAFISAWYHLAGLKEQRDKATHSCVNLISALGLADERVFKSHFEAERIWRRALSREGG